LLAPPSYGLLKKTLSAKRTPAQAQMTLCNKMDDSVEMGPPPKRVWGGLFPKSNPVYKNVQLIEIMLSIDYLLTVV